MFGATTRDIGMDEVKYGEILLPGDADTQNRREKTVRQKFWPTFRRAVRQIPFSRDVVAGFYCALDPQTPARVRGVLLAALAYFVMPVDIIPDVFAVIGGKGIYKVDFTGSAPKSSLIKTITEASNLNGLAVFNNDTVLVADAGKGSVYKFTISTGEYAVALTDPTMAPSGGIPFGIDGIKYKDGTVWYTNIFKNSFHKVAVDPVTAKATGAVTTLWTNLMGDDLCFGPNGKIYVATNSKNSIVEVDPAVGKPTVVATVTGSTSCAFGRTEADKNVIYVGGGQGVFSATIKV